MWFVRKPGFEVFCHLALVSDEVQGSVSGRCGVLVRSPQYYCDVRVLGSGFWVLDFGFWVLGSGFWVLVHRSVMGTWQPGFCVQEVRMGQVLGFVVRAGSLQVVEKKSGAMQRQCGTF